MKGQKGEEEGGSGRAKAARGGWTKGLKHPHGLGVGKEDGVRTKTHKVANACPAHLTRRKDRKRKSKKNNEEALRSVYHSVREKTYIRQ